MKPTELKNCVKCAHAVSKHYFENGHICLSFMCTIKKEKVTKKSLMCDKFLHFEIAQRSEF